MSFTITIDCEPEDIEAHLAALGLMRRPSVPPPHPDQYYRPSVEQVEPKKVPEVPVSEEQSAPKSRGGRPRKEQPAPPAEAAQDAADEKAETEKNKPAELTHNDVRKAIHEYSKKHGVTAATNNIRDLLGGKAIDAVPATQEALRDAIAKIEAATAAPLSKDEPKVDALFGVGETEPEREPEPRAAKKEVNEAARLYGVKYDGTTDPKQMVHTAPDVRAILSEALSMKVVDFNSFPDEPLICGRAKAAIMKAIEENPFKREIKG